MSKCAAECLPITLLILGAASLAAQDVQTWPDFMNMSLEELMQVDIDSVYGASKYKQSVTDAPAAITIITGEEIQRFGYRTLAGILRKVPGFYVSYDRNYSYAGVRGFSPPGDYNSRILLLVNGHRVNDNVFDQALLGTEFPVDIDLIDRVEVIRGPTSSLYVANAFLGTINVITKSPPQQRQITAGGEWGSFGASTARLNYGQQFDGGWGLLLSGSYYRSAGQALLYFKEFDTAETNNGIAEDADSDESHQLFGALTHGDLRLEGVYGWRKKGVPTASFDTVFNDSRLHTIDAHGYLDLAYSRRFGSDWGFTGRVYYDRGHYDGTYPYASETTESGTILNRDIAEGQWWGGEFAVSKHLFENHTLIMGSEYRGNFQQDQTNYDEQPYFRYFDSRATSKLWAIYAQDEFRVLPKLTVGVGLRHDQYSTFGGSTNPRVALIYKASEKTALKLLLGRSFRAPNAYELYYAGEGQEGNPNLRPEIARTAEVVLEHYFQNHVRLLISGYYFPIRELIRGETNPASGNFVYRNNARTNLRGMEVSIKKQTRGGVEAGLGFSFQDAQAGAGQAVLTNSPRVVGQGNLSVPLVGRKLYASATVDFVGRRRTALGYAGAYVRPDFTLFSPAFRNMQVSASLYNAFGRRYEDPAGIGNAQDVIVQDGRTFRLKFAYRF